MKDGPLVTRAGGHSPREGQAPAPGRPPVRLPGRGPAGQGRRYLPAWVVLGVVAGTTALLAWLPLPFLVVAPGQVFDLAQMVRVPGAGATGPGVGLVTVAAHPARGWEVALALFHPWQEVTSTASLPLPVEQYMEAERLLFRESAHFAAVAAFSLAGDRVEPAGGGVVVQWVTPDSPLHGRIRPGEVLEGYPTTFHLRRGLREHGLVRVWVGGGELQLGPGDLRGVGLATVDPAVPGVPLTLSGEEVGGPSGGLACGLEVLRQLGRVSIAAGLRVAATGTLDPSGEVGRTGGVALKARAARAAGVGLFLVPAGQEEEARRAAPGLEVAGVGSLAEAVAILALRR